MTDDATDSAESSGWVRVCASDVLLPGETRVEWVGELPLLLLNLDGEIHALEDRCSHEDFELSPGEFDAAEGTIECVLHGARFDVRSGEALCAPAYSPVRRFAARRADGAIWVSVEPAPGA